MGNLKLEAFFASRIPKICVPLTSTTEAELLEESQLVEASAADVVEWRVDFYEHALEMESVLRLLPKIKQALGERPLLFSFRTADEGGEKTISNEQYIALNQAVIASGFVDFVDIEFFKGRAVVREIVSVAKEHGVLTIGSNHDFQQTPALEDLTGRIETAFELGLDVPKLAVMPVKAEDTLTLLEASLATKRKYEGRPVIMIAMGKLGVLSRFSGEIFGSALTFAALKNASAPGQISVEKMNMILQLIHEA